VESLAYFANTVAERAGRVCKRLSPGEQLSGLIICHAWERLADTAADPRCLKIRLHIFVPLVVARVGIFTMASILQFVRLTDSTTA